MVRYVLGWILQTLYNPMYKPLFESSTLISLEMCFSVLYNQIVRCTKHPVLPIQSIQSENPQKIPILANSWTEFAVLRSKNRQNSPTFSPVISSFIHRWPGGHSDPTTAQTKLLRLRAERLHCLSIGSTVPSGTRRHGAPQQPGRLWLLAGIQWGKCGEHIETYEKIWERLG